MIAVFERVLFRHRGITLAVLGVFTLVMAGYASQIRLETAFQKHLPIGHPYVDTFLEYQDQLVGVNRVVLVLRARHGDIWNPDYFRKLSEATDALFFMDGIDRRTVTSLWTPNIRTIEITEEGMRAEDMIGGDITVDSLTQEDVDQIRDRVIRSGLVGRLVSNDFTMAMVTGEALDVSAGSAPLDTLALADRLEALRDKLSDDAYDVHLLGFVTMSGFIGRGVKAVVFFFTIAFLLTGGAVHLYTRSWKLSALPLLCSLVCTVWQFGMMSVLGYGLDPLAILVPFLVFAIGVSHGIQQVNLFTMQILAGDDSMAAARTSFRGLLVPGSMALFTDLVAFVTLLLIPIPLVQDLGVTAAIGVAFKVVSNLVMLPVLASYLTLDAGFAQRTLRSRAVAEKVMDFVGRLAEPGHAARTLGAFAIILGLAVWQSAGRHVGDLHPGATELRPDSRYNRDAALIVEKFDIGLDVLIVVAETEPQSCIDYETLAYIDLFTWHMRNAPGVISTMSTPVIAKVIAAAWNEGNLEWQALPRNRYALVQATSSIPSGLGVVNADCTLMPIQVYTSDHKAETIKHVLGAAKEFRDQNPSDKVNLRLASGNIGIQGATNEALERAEVPMMLYAYASIVVLVLITYRSWRAVICCALPLTVATFLGYWFMKELEIGIKVSTLPVMVLAVGIGVDYAFYIYNRLQRHVQDGLDITRAYQQALRETGNAVVFTAITLSIGVATWSASPLKFQADMGALLSFMFAINMVMAATLLPALAVILDRLRPMRAAGAASLALLCLTLPDAAGAEQDVARSPAVPSKLAAQTLLLDATRAGDRIVAVGSWGHVILSDDEGRSWRQAVTVPARSVLTDVAFVDETLGWAVGHDGVILHSADGGETWQAQRVAPDEETPLFSVDFEDARRGMAVGAFGLALRTEDGGRTWERFSLHDEKGDEESDEEEEDLHLNQLFRDRDGAYYIAAEVGTVYRQEEGGERWTRLQTGYTGSFWGGLGLEDGGLLVFGLRGHVLRSDDRGETWTQLEAGTDQSLAGGTTLEDGTVVLAGLGGAIVTSRDGGRSFQATTRESRRGASTVLGADTARLLLFGEGGVEEVALPAPE